MSDILRLDYINSLPQPFLAELLGDKEGYGAEVILICVETGLMQLNICGRIDRCHISDVSTFVDMAGVRHDPDSFWADFDDSPQEPKP